MKSNITVSLRLGTISTGSSTLNVNVCPANSSPSKLFITNHQATAEDPKNKFIVTDPDYNVLEADMRHDDFIDGLYNGLIGVRAGEECEIAFSGKHGFGNVVFGTIPANSALLYKIWVIGVSNE